MAVDPKFDAENKAGGGETPTSAGKGEETGQLSPYADVYDLDYFSGSQTFLYIGDVWVDEITSLEFTMVQQKTPLYGYASQLFDDTAAGTALVQGSFSINYKEAGYLWAVLRRYKQIQPSTTKIFGAGLAQANLTSTDIVPESDRTIDLEQILQQDTRRPIISAENLDGSFGTRFSTAPIQRLVAGDLTVDEQYQVYDNIAGYATFDTDTPRDRLFEDLMEVFEDQIWKGSGPNNRELLEQIRRTDQNVFDDFDMYIVTGNFLNDKANHSVKKIIGVRLTSQGMQVVIDGSPIQESYEFLARSIA